jgi:hypothetical protein
MNNNVLTNATMHVKICADMLMSSSELGVLRGFIKLKLGRYQFLIKTPPGARIEVLEGQISL